MMGIDFDDNGEKKTMNRLENDIKSMSNLNLSEMDYKEFRKFEYKIYDFLKHYILSLEKNPDNKEDIENLLEKAIDKLEEACQHYDKDVWDSPFYYIIGMGEYKVGNERKASKFFDKAIRYDPKSVDGWFGKGIYLFTNGDLSQSILYFQKILDLNPDDEKRKEKAQEYIDEALKSLES